MEKVSFGVDLINNKLNLSTPFNEVVITLLIREVFFNVCQINWHIWFEILSTVWNSFFCSIYFCYFFLSYSIKRKLKIKKNWKRAKIWIWLWNVINKCHEKFILISFQLKMREEVFLHCNIVEEEIEKFNEWFLWHVLMNFFFHDFFRITLELKKNYRWTFLLDIIFKHKLKIF